MARIEDRNHLEALVPRTYELGGKLPVDMNEFHDASACKPARLPADPTDVTAMLTVLVEAERCAVRGYTHICNLTADPSTHDEDVRAGRAGPLRRTRRAAVLCRLRRHGPRRG